MHLTLTRTGLLIGFLIQRITIMLSVFYPKTGIVCTRSMREINVVKLLKVFLIQSLIYLNSSPTSSSSSSNHTSSGGGSYGS